MWSSGIWGLFSISLKLQNLQYEVINLPKVKMTDLISCVRQIGSCEPSC